MSYFRALMVFIFVCTSAVNLHASESTSKPWYSIKKIDELQIFVNFPKHIMSIDPVYFFHIRFMVSHLKKDKSLHLYIYKKNNRVSEARARVIKNYLVQVLGAPEDRVHVLVENLRYKYNENTSERLRVLLTRSIFFKDNKPIGPEVVEIIETKTAGPPKKNNGKAFEFGLLSRASKFVEDYDAYGGGLMFKFTLNTKKALRFHLEGEVISIDRLEWEPEMHFAIGVESIYDTIESATQIYFKKNYIEEIGTQNFQGYQDVGLSQKVWFNLFRRSSFIYKVGASGEFSFSNNSAALQNSNVLTYGFETGFYLKSGYHYKVFYIKRKLRDLSGFGDSTEHLGFSFSYEF